MALSKPQKNLKQVGAATSSHEQPKRRVLKAIYSSIRNRQPTKIKVTHIEAQKQQKSTFDTAQENRDWLTVSASTFDFWDNDLDAEYDADDDAIHDDKV
jgi:hypothetical protein